VLTALEKKIINFLGEYLRAHSGRSPTLAEIGDGCGIRSLGTIHRYLCSIEAKGYLSKEGSGWRARLAPTELPYCGKVAAGKPIGAIDQAERIDLSSLLMQPDCFVLTIEGDSMVERGILDGDLVIVKSSKTARNGQIVVALVENEATLKEFQSMDGGRRIKLIPYNRNLVAQTYPADQVEIQGILVSVVRINP